MTTVGWYPKAIAKPIPAGSSDPAIKPRVAIAHVRDGLGESLYPMFSANQRSGGSQIEAHFYVRYDGTIEQYRSIFVQCDANYLANPFAVSIETEGLAAGEWTPQQLASLKALMLWLHEAAEIPLVQCPEWDGAGFGWHIQFGTPGKWTNVAKSCPGPKRITQFKNILVPWMKSLAAPRKTPNITAFRLAKTNAGRRKAAEAVAKSGSPAARADALDWLDAIADAAAAKKSLLSREVK